MHGKSGGQSGTEAGVLLFIPLKVGESGSELGVSRPDLLCNLHKFLSLSGPQPGLKAERLD